jgi:hypothetical protein
MFGMEGQYKHHVPQPHANVFGARLLLADAIDRNWLIITVLVIDVNRLKPFSESLDFETQLQMFSHLLCGNTHGLQAFFARRKTRGVNKQLPVTVLMHAWLTKITVA